MTELLFSVDPSGRRVNQFKTDPPAPPVWYDFRPALCNGIPGLEGNYIQLSAYRRDAVDRQNYLLTPADAKELAYRLLTLAYQAGEEIAE